MTSIPGQASSDSNAAALKTASEELDWLRSFAVIIANCGTYGAEHVVTRDAIDQSYRSLERIHKVHNVVEIRMTKEGLQINGRPYRTTVVLEKKLRQIPVQSVAINRGMSREDYGKLAKLIHEGNPVGAPDGKTDFLSKLNAAGIRNLTMKKSHFVEIQESEMVVAKDRVRSAAAGGPAGRAGGGGARPGLAGAGGSGHAGRLGRSGVAGAGATGMGGAGSGRAGSASASSAPAPAPPASTVTAPASAFAAPATVAAASAPETAAPAAPLVPSAAAPVAPPPDVLPSPAASVTAAGTPGTADTAAIQLPATVVGEIIAFLKGSVNPAAEAEASISIALRDAASDPGQLASLILRAVDVRQQETPLAGGETLSDVVVGCLRRAVGGIKKAPGGQTQKAQRDTIRTLTVFEAQVLDRMHKLADEDKAQDAEMENIKSAVKEMKLQVEAESIASQFAKQKSAAADAEKTLAKFIARNGPDNLEAAGVREMLLESGLTPEGWNRLVVTSKQRAGKGDKGKSTGSGAGDGGGTDSQLTALLANLAVVLDKIDDDKDSDGGFARALARVDGEVDRLIAQTDSKITALAEAARRIAIEDAQMAGKAGGAETGTDELSKRRLLGLMAEVISEFRQPLSVINSSVTMLQTPGVGTLTPVQEQLVALVGKSQTRIGALAERLARII